MKQLLFLYLLLFSIPIFAQQSKKLDSLKAVLAKLPVEGRSFAGDTTRVRLLCEMGEVYLDLRKYTLISIGLKALQISTTNNYTLGMMKANILIGKYYHSQSLSIKSSEYFLKALAIAENFKLINEVKFLTVEVGANFMTLGNNDKALKYFEKYSNLCKKYGTQEDYLLSFNNIGIIYYNQKKYGQALKYFRVCEAGSEKSTSPKVKNVGLINVAMVLVELGNYDEALQRYDKAITIEDGYKDRISFIAKEKATIFLKKNNLRYALKNALFALENTKKTAPSVLRDVSLITSTIYQKMNKLDKALFFYKQYATLSQSQDSIKTNQLIRFMNLDYQNEKQVQQIQNLNDNVEKQERQKNIAITISILVVIILIVIYFFYKALQQKNNEIEKQKLAIEDLNITLEKKVQLRTKELLEANHELLIKNKEITEALFKGQKIERKRVASELHDNLGSTLSALKWRFEALNIGTLSEKEKKIYDGILLMIGNAYEEVRHISHNLLPVEFDTRGLIGAVQKLCDDLNQIERLSINFRTEGDFESIDNKITLELYSIILELVNNILKHSGANKGEIILINNNEVLQLEIKDNGSGFQLEKDLIGFGLKNIENRLSSLQGELMVENLEIGTKISIVIPHI